MYSALKHQGQPLYKLARQGLEVARKPRPVVIETLELLRLGPTELELRCRCGSGTYIRTLGESIAAALGTCGHLSALRREYVEPFAGQAMVQMDDVEAGRLPANLIPAEQGVPQLPACHLNAEQTLRLQRGQVQVLPAELLTVAAGAAAAATVASLSPQLVRLYDSNGEFFGLGAWSAPNSLRAKRLYASSCSP
jgi:tRNA pseudouridine55 synthase